jgi:hypothetical protein
MFVALGFLLGLIALCSATLIVDGTIVPSLFPLLAAGGLALVAIYIPPVEAKRFQELVKPVAVGAAIPALWILLQMIPLPFGGLAHPVWGSVRGDLSSSVAGSISVDIGATAIALVRYLTFVGALFLATAVTINRDRAETVLVSLAAVTTLISLGHVVSYGFGLESPAVWEEVVSCACLGAILTAACAAFVYERHETRRAKLGFGEAKFIYPLLTSLAAFLICAMAIGLSHSGSVILAACCGVGMFISVFLVRRLHLGRWGAGAIGVTAIVIVAALASGAAGSNKDPMLAFVKKDPVTLELTQRILADAPFFGDGAGAFSSVLPIYQFGDSGAHERRAVTFAAKLSIEMGRPMLWAAVITAGLAAALLLQASTKRGRDSFYPTAAASCLVSLIVLAFINVSLFGQTLPMLSVIILGLGLAQSRGRPAV